MVQTGQGDLTDIVFYRWHSYIQVGEQDNRKIMEMGCVRNAIVDGGEVWEGEICKNNLQQWV